MKMATEAVYKFLKDQNRPFNINDILQSFGKDHGKSAIQKSLDTLVQKQKIIEKTYGKQKIYCVFQDENIDPQNLEKELREIDREINEISTNLDSIEQKLQSNIAEIKSLQVKMTTEEAKVEKEKLEGEIKNMKCRLKELTENVEPISEEDKQKINKEHEMYEKEYRKRKRICMEMINTIMEGYPKSKKHLIEDIGIETDEEVEFKLD